MNTHRQLLVPDVAPSSSPRWVKLRSSRIILLLFTLALAGLCGDARATYAESAIFAFDTRDSNSTHYGESNSFAFNTRAIEGQRWAGFGWV